MTGEEEYWSRTDLWDFQANVDGARVGFDGLRPLLQRKDADAGHPDRRAGSPPCRSCWTQQKEGDGFVSYDELSAAEVKALSDAVNALSEPLSEADRGRRLMSPPLMTDRARSEPAGPEVGPSVPGGDGAPARAGVSRRGLLGAAGGRGVVGVGRGAGRRPRSWAGAEVGGGRAGARQPRSYPFHGDAPGRASSPRPRTGCTSPRST